ncbi:carboxypeptidase-like regulatory domain-containing protein [Aegicerativicinus sediminis]|uniref:carboxypeptidase-like regulatory domain-containing protein n=1 Tax=Aegicerativicinus sediminis TaxID=2893202 RepID=UPI001E494A1F|nr:carboxypeptidase-like regulatory domain-containing protein [Aegicerativicinus sediminis]
MLRYNFYYPIIFLISLLSFPQQFIKGNVVDAGTLEPLSNVIIWIENTTVKTETSSNGDFSLIAEIPIGEYLIRMDKGGYITKRFPITILADSTIDLRGLTMDVDAASISQEFIISLTDDELSNESAFVGNNSGLLQATKDVFLKAVAYDFSSVFFNPRGLDPSFSKILINGIEMNKFQNGRPLWANWGGLNDVQRNQEFFIGSTPNPYSLGNIGGTNNINMRASKYRSGGRVSLASSNRTYQGRIMTNYNSGIINNDWSFSIAASGRYGKEGFVEGTPYKSISFFAAVEKKINDNHSINLIGIYSENIRGKSAPLTEEVFNIKGTNYNPYWGELNGNPVNSRIREIAEPFFILSHYWDPNSKIKINSNLSYQFGHIANTRIDNSGTWQITHENQTSYFGGSRNPDPTYYQKLPSYFLRNGGAYPSSYDYEMAFMAQKELKENGQINWYHLYQSNRLLRESGKNAVYVLQEERNDDKLINVNTLIEYQINTTSKVNGGLYLKKLNSHNYSRIKDLLGGNPFLDIDVFADETGIEGSTIETLAQSDLKNPNRLVGENDLYKYNFKLSATEMELFSQFQFTRNNLDGYIGSSIVSTAFERNGLFENGHYPGNDSYGKSNTLHFLNIGFKTGGTYRISGKQIIELHTFFSSNAPTLSHSFLNPRQNNYTVSNLKNEINASLVTNYIYRSERFNGRLTGNYSESLNSVDISYYYTEDLASLGLGAGDVNVQEAVTEIDIRRIGLEIGGVYELTSSLKLKSALSFGSSIYIDNPNLYLRSDKFSSNLKFGNGKVNLKNLHTATGPERVAQIGLEYNDPAFWWLGTTVNFYSHQYIDVSYLTRSENFTRDYDGQPILNFDPNMAKQLLKQEKFNDFFLCNIVGGKSWRINDYYLGFFGVLSNVFNQFYKTGGFEQSRIAKYTTLLEEKNRKSGPVFGPKYFYGYGTTFYLSLNLRY